MKLIYKVIEKLRSEVKQVTSIEWCALSFVLPGVWYICVDVHVIGLYLMFVAQMCWLTHAWKTKQLILGTQAVVLNAMNIYGIANWTANNIGQ